MAITAQEQDRLAGALTEIRPHLNERQWRLLLGAQARAVGRGGIKLVARAAGASVDTVGRGAGELEAGISPDDRVRAVGAGRRSVEAVDPGLVAAVEALVAPESRGDPQSPLRMDDQVQRPAGRGVDHPGTSGGCADGRPTADPGRVLTCRATPRRSRANSTRTGTPSSATSPRRVVASQAAGDPVISVDTKKKLLVGNYANGGAEWEPTGAPRRTNVHDFADPELGKAVPYGVYDVTANTGWVNVGTDADTGQFAVESIRRWWHAVGQTNYPAARRVLITADSGGSNGSRLRLWKTELATFAAETDLEITVLHLPPGPPSGTTSNTACSVTSR